MADRMILDDDDLMRVNGGSQEELDRSIGYIDIRFRQSVQESGTADALHDMLLKLKQRCWYDFKDGFINASEYEQLEVILEQKYADYLKQVK